MRASAAGCGYRAIVFTKLGWKVASRTAIWPSRERLIDSPRMRAASAGAWNPVEFSASTKSSRNCACRWSFLAQRQLFVAAAGGHRRLEVHDQRDEGIHRLIAQQLGALLDRLDARLQLLLRPAVAGLAGVVDVQQRAAHVVVADLLRADAFVGHVAVGAGDAGARVNALAPHLELGVLRLERRRAEVLCVQSLWPTSS